MSEASTQNGGIISILLTAAQGREAVQQIWAYKKTLEPKFSLAYFGKKIGLQSRGTLSDTLKGIRRWPRKYWKALGPALDLAEPEAELLALLLERDESDATQEIVLLERQIDSIRRLLRQRFFKFEVKRGLTLLASDVFCYFTMRAGEITERAIIDYFGKCRFADVLRALQILVDNGLIEKTALGYQRCEDNAKFFAFRMSEIDHPSAFLREAIQDAEEQMSHWHTNTIEACFGTTTMSVKREHYEKMLVQFRKEVFRFFSELETNEGDTIIRFNLQVYPVVGSH